MKLIEENRMFDKMKAGIPVLGCQVRSRSTLIAEMAAYCGLDYVFIEGELANSPSKLGVNTPLPMFSSISFRVTCRC